MSAAPVIHNNDDRVEAILERVRELAVLPHVVYKVLELSGSSDASASEIERAIVVDPGFSSKLLTAANSAYYGLPRKVTSIREAIMFLGFRVVRQIAMTVGVYDMFVGKNDKESLRRRTWWRHSVDTAVCARWLAKETGALSQDSAYTSGLLHYIGKSLLDRFGGEDYELTVPMIEAGMKDFEAERELYGCDHVFLAQAAARKWGFPEELIAGMDYIKPAPEDSEWQMHNACVAIASAIGFMVVDGSFSETEHQFPEWATAKLGISSDRYSEIVTAGRRVIAESASLSL